MRLRVLAPVALLIILATALPVLAGDLHGKITDRTGSVLDGATISILNVATGEETTVVADSAGQYRVPAGTIGTYRVAVRHAGFSEASRTVIIETDSADVTADFTLELG